MRVHQPTSVQEDVGECFVEREASGRAGAFGREVDVDRVFVAADVARTAAQFFEERTDHVTFSGNRNATPSSKRMSSVSRHIGTSSIRSRPFRFVLNAGFMVFRRCVESFLSACGDSNSSWICGVITSMPFSTSSRGADSVSAPRPQ